MKLTRFLVCICALAIVTTTGCGKRTTSAQGHKSISTVKWGYINKRGQFIIKPRYVVAGSFHEGLACVFLRRSQNEFDHGPDWDECIFINKTGKKIFSLHAICDDFSYGLAVFGTGFDTMDGQPNKWGFVDKTGNVVIKQGFRVAQPFSEGLALVEPIDGGTPGYIDTSGHFVIRMHFEYGDSFSEGLAAVTIKGKTGYINRLGRMVIKPRFIDGGSFHCGLARILCRDKYAYIDQQGVIVIKPRFGESEDFSEGLAKFRDMDTLKYGYIDTNGKVKIKARYDDALSFHEGLALVRLGYKQGYINKNGNMVISSLPSTKECIGCDDAIDTEWNFSEGFAPY